MFTCPMHSEVRQPEPGSCPHCGMALVREGEHVMREPMSMMAREHYTPYRWVQAVIASLAL